MDRQNVNVIKLDSDLLKLYTDIVNGDMNIRLQKQLYFKVDVMLRFIPKPPLSASWLTNPPEAKSKHY